MAHHACAHIAKAQLCHIETGLPVLSRFVLLHTAHRWRLRGKYVSGSIANPELGSWADPLSSPADDLSQVAVRATLSFIQVLQAARPLSKLC